LLAFLSNLSLLPTLALLPLWAFVPAEPVVVPPPPPPAAAIEVPRVRAQRAAGAVVLDGSLNEPSWASAPRISDFRQTQPFGGELPSETTEVRILYDEEALYFGFFCVHRQAPIVGRLTRRDHDSESEWALVQIDSRREGKVAYQFAVNVAGVLVDAVLHDGMLQSFDWDENWEARTARVTGGWTAELRIPFRALRFSAAEGASPTLGIQVTRLISATQERVDWPWIPRENPAPIPLYAVLEGLEGIRPGGRWELRPFVLGQVRRDGDPATRQAGLYPSVAAGLDLKLHLTDSLTLDVATLPDFGQVEADQVVLNLNNYEVLYPEKRPLFLEGAEAFSTQLQLFYSRRIGSISESPSLRPSTSTLQETLVRQPGAPSIYAAAKVAGRVGESWNVVGQSALVARSAAEVDAQDPTTGRTNTESRTLAPRSLMSVLRLRREYDNQSHVGLLATSANRFQSASDTSPCPAVLAQTGSVVTGRCFHDAYAGSLDGLWRSHAGTYSVAGQLAGTWLRGGRDSLQPDGNVIHPGAMAPAFWGRVAKDGGRHWLGSLAYTFLGKEADFNDLGYMQRQNLSNAHAMVEYRTLEPGTATLETHTKFEFDSRFNLDGVSLAQNGQLGWRARMRRYTWLGISLIGGPARFDDREVGALTGFSRYAFERAAYVGLRTDITTDLRGLVVAQMTGEATAIAGGAHALKGKASVFLHPLPQLEMEVDPELTWEGGEPRLAWNSGAQTSSELFFGRLDARSASLTLRASYAFLPRLSLQTYGQVFLASGHYQDFSAFSPSALTSDRRIRLRDLQPVAALPRSDFEQAVLNLNVVLRWEWMLGSTLFLVYTRSQSPAVNLPDGAAAHLDAAALRAGGGVDVVLLKLAYWWAS